VFITNRGRPEHVLLTFEEYQKLAGKATNIIDALHLAGVEDVDFEPPKLEGELFKKADLS
jgi:hypothetical protein